MRPEFKPFPKLARLRREIIISEKIDGSNASVFVTADGEIYAASRTRWITPEDDNFGFAAWVRDHRDQLLTLGPGHHFGEWWGRGIQRGYGIDDRRFSLFNVARWCLHGTEPAPIISADPRIVKMQDVLPPCCGLVPMLYSGDFCDYEITDVLFDLSIGGSQAALGFPHPEGIVVYHTAGNVGFKVTLEKDNQPKNKCKH